MSFNLKKYIPSTYHQILLYAFLSAWLWSSVNPKQPAEWEIETKIILLFFILILIFIKAFKLTDLSLTAITVFLFFHIIGAHYNYEKAPFGFILQSWFNTDKNIYSNFIYFSYGGLIYFPIREVLNKVNSLNKSIKQLLPITLTVLFFIIYKSTSSYIFTGNSLVYINEILFALSGSIVSSVLFKILFPKY
ncbi:MAG: DUF2238 domain-containing protein [Bacteroidetes bacterium]|nr:DUF2238 domain-containing protein [Bacteroidota bacterium]